jgi:quercetin dioxygenase-like cupin family protein
MKARITLVLWVVLAVVVAATQGHHESSGSSATPTAGSGVTRSVLVGATPASAPDQSLQLVRYVIQPGTKLPAHVHPGTQIASIVSGELTYSVVSGQIRVERAAPNGTPGPVEWLKAGETTVLRPGDAVIETEGMVHFGENLGSEPVVILAATLLEAGQPPSIIEEATPAT